MDVSHRYPDPATVTGQVGDTFTVTFLGMFCSGSDLDFDTDSGTPASPSSGTLTSYEEQTFTITGSGQMSFGTVLTLIVDVPTPSTPATDTAALPSPPWVQAYGIFPRDDACEKGWTNSWQEWAEPFTGGRVCTRSIPSLG